MSAYRDRIYPVLVDRLGIRSRSRRFGSDRSRSPEASCSEIGAGSGANFPYHDQVKVERLYALEPNPGMRRLAEHRRRADLEIEFLSLPGERIPLVGSRAGTPPHAERQDASLLIGTVRTSPDDRIYITDGKKGAMILAHAETHDGRHRGQRAVARDIRAPI